MAFPPAPGAEHHHEEGEEEEEEEEEGPVTIGLEQIRADLRASVNLGGFFESINLRAGYSDYEHTEFEGDEIGTLFFVEGVEARAELVQREKNGWRGVVGTQYLVRDFNAVGAEAFVPQNDLESWALFSVQEVDLGDFEVEGALRFESTDIKANAINFDRNFDAFSAALGLVYSPGEENLKIGANLTRSERAPSAEELLSNGPHIAPKLLKSAIQISQQKKAGAVNYSPVGTAKIFN